MHAKKSPEQTGQVNHEPGLSVDSAAAEAMRKSALIAALAERGWIAVELSNGDFAFQSRESNRERRRARGLAGLELVARVICGAEVVGAIRGADAVRTGGAER